MKDDNDGQALPPLNDDTTEYRMEHPSPHSTHDLVYEERVFSEIKANMDEKTTAFDVGDAVGAAASALSNDGVSHLYQDSDPAHQWFVEQNGAFPHSDCHGTFTLEQDTINEFISLPETHSFNETGDTAEFANDKADENIELEQSDDEYNDDFFEEDDF